MYQLISILKSIRDCNVFMFRVCEPSYFFSTGENVYKYYIYFVDGAVNCKKNYIEM